MNIYTDIAKVFDGGPGSGNFGHGGRPGKVGGSQTEQNAKAIEKIEKKTKANFKNYIDKRIFNHPEKHSLAKYLDKNNNLKKERRQIWNKAFAEQLAGVHQTNHPVIYFNGGGTASGKSTALKSIEPNSPTKNNKSGVIIDPDEFKKQLPEYKEMLKSGDSKAAEYCHEESSTMAKVFQNAIINSGRYSALIDGTLGGDLEKTISKIRSAKALGKPVIGNFVTVDYDEALKRAYKRHLSEGRFPDVDDVLKIHQGVSTNFPVIFKEFDNGKLVDNNGKKAKVIAEFENGKLVIKDKAAYQKFIEKQKLTKSDINRLKNNLKKNMKYYKNEWMKENPGEIPYKDPEI